MRLLALLAFVALPSLLQAQSKPPVFEWPLDSATVHLVKDGARTPYTRRTPVTLEGDVTVEISKGRLRFADLNFTYAPDARVEVVGAGREQTLLDRYSGGNTYNNAIYTNGATVIFRAMTVKDPSLFTNPNLKRPRDSSVLFVDCRIVGNVTMPTAVAGAPRLSPTFVVAALFSTFDTAPLAIAPGSEFKGFAMLVAYSWVRDAKGRLVPLHQDEFGISPATMSMGDAAKRWRAEADAKQPLGIGNMRIIAETSPAMLSSLAQLKLQAGHAEHIARVVREGVGLTLAVGPSLVDAPAQQRALALAADFRGRGLRIVESLALQQALAASGMNPDAALQAQLGDNRRALAATYGCHLTFDNSRNKAQSTAPIDTTHLFRVMRRELRALTDLFTLESESTSSCQIVMAPITDFFIGANQASSTTTTSEWQESPESLLRKKRMREAAEAAAWQAQKARLDALSNSITNTAQQLSAQRPRLETIGSGTYLVVDRRETTTGPSAIDVQRANERTDRYNEAARRYNSAKSEMVEIKTRTTISWQNRRDGVQYELFLKHRDGFERHLVAPYEEATVSLGPCRYEIKENHVGIYEPALLSGPCGRLGPNYNFREGYYARFFTELIHEFAVQQHLSRVLSEAGRKAGATSDEERLDGMLLAYLVSDKVDVKEIEALAKRVFGKDVDADALRKRVIFN